MGQTLSRIRNLYAYEDGDQIEARMGVKIDDGFGLTQYWDPNRKAVVNTDFTQHPVILYPQPYSSKRGEFVLPERQGQQWYYNNPETSSAAILGDDGQVKAAYADLFEIASILVSGKQFPALKIKGNLANENDLTDKHIYYKSTYGGKPFTCSQLIPIQTTVGDAIELVLTVTAQDGSGSTALTDTNTQVVIVPALLRAGTAITDNVTFQWQRFVAGEWQNVVHEPSVREIKTYSDGTTVLKLFNAGVDCEEVFRCAAVYQGKTYYASIQVTDQADAYYIYDGCSQAGDAVEAGVNVTFQPVVYKRTGNIPDTDYQWKFSFFLYNLVTGAELVDFKKTNVNTYTVQYETLEANKGVSVIISATNE